MMSYNNFGSSRRRRNYAEIDDAIVKDAEPLIRHLARKIIIPGSTLYDDILQEGRIGLCRALESRPGIKLGDRLVWAIPWIMGNMRNFLAKSASTIYVPVERWKDKEAIEPVVNMLSLDEFTYADDGFGTPSQEDTFESVHMSWLLNQLGDLERSTIELYIGGFTYKEIAGKLNTSYDKVVTAYGTASRTIADILGVKLDYESSFPAEKRCSKCGRVLPNTAFGRKNGGRLMLSECKQCVTRRVCDYQRARAKRRRELCEVG